MQRCQHIPALLRRQKRTRSVKGSTAAAGGSLRSLIRTQASSLGATAQSRAEPNQWNWTENQRLKHVDLDQAAAGGPNM